MIQLRSWPLVEEGDKARWRRAECATLLVTFVVTNLYSGRADTEPVPYSTLALEYLARSTRSQAVSSLAPWLVASVWFTGLGEYTTLPVALSKLGLS